MNSGEKVKHGALWSVLFAVVSLAWIFPIVLVIINSFKQKAYISRNAFSLPTGKAFVGLENYTRGLETTNFFASFGWTLLITVGSVALILVCTSMCAWWIVRVNNWAAKLLYTLFLFNMIVPFQMVMFTLSKLADMLKLNTPWGLCFVYLGFGAGLAVFIFTGVVKGIPESLEESAMIDGASVPRIFFQIVVPIMKPSIVSVAILQAMWIWNDYLLPYLTLDLGKYKTISVAVQYLKGGYGSVDMGAMMACLVMAIIPIIIFYLICQNHLGCQGLHVLLDITLQRPCTVDRIISIVHDILHSFLRQTDGQLLILQTSVQIGNDQMNDAADIVLGQRLEQDRLIQTVQKFRTEMSPQVVHDCRLCLRLDGAVFVDTVQQIACADVGGHDQYGILKVYGTTLRIRDTAVIQYL